ncbi:MAG: extracellular solute-binding protein family 1 [Blastococcus sp.]|jgi:multiple sugar transport system substrate-binding protein|nr:extracellular solute-binding protein family 1 [Blastococcus sp.]
MPDRRVLATVALTVTALLGAACSSGTDSASSEALKAGTGFLDGGVLDGKPYDGEEIGVWTLATATWSKYQNEMSSEFESLTGITVKFNDIPEAGWTDKVRLAQVARDSSYDVWEGDVAFKGEYDGRSAIEPLDPYVTSSVASPTDFLSDFPAGNVDLCTLDGKMVCVPEWSSGPMLYYNKQLLADAGFSEPPKTFDEFVEIAKATKTDEIAGVCETGSAAQNLTWDVYVMSQYFLKYSDKEPPRGVFLGSDWEPQFETAEALEFGRVYQDLLLNYGPEGIANYGYVECTRDFQQGKVAMWLDNDLYVGQVLDPANSQVADQVGFAQIPCPPVNPNHCMPAIGKGWFVNPNSEKKGPAWEYIKWVTSKDATTEMVQRGNFYGGAIRQSALSSVSSELPEDLATALAYQKDHLNPNSFPPIPELVQLVIGVSDTFSKIIAGADVQDEFAALNAKYTQTLQEGGHLK